ncbi:pyruvate dehydrogenase (acetyl-transferring) E1 component subunit alpha [Pseudomonas aeruginosa]|nr:pyruvate dehydrogenase (acetyl-transferring) E1 component subunit alpha [Pseudomonas aeruginosa]
MVHNRIDPPFTRYLDSDGRPLGELPARAGDSDALVGLYRQMLLTRLFDQKAVALQRTGRIGTYAPTLGQEAIGVAIGSQMRAEDVLVPYYRDTAVQLMRGVRMEDILLYWGGDERGSDYAEPLAAQDFPICVPIATQALHACGVASAFRIRGEHRVAVTTCGDGATSKGDFLEALNVAGAWQLPVLFVVNNNQWAISVPRRIQCGAPTLAEKAVGAGFPGEQVDGNDVLAVAERVRAALERARQGKGPTLLECISYRLCDHTTADDASRYRSAEEVNQAWREEPIKRLRAFLAGRGQWDEEREQALVGECQARVQEAVERFETFAAQAPQALFEHVYARWPAALEEQREQLLERARGGREGPNMNERNGEAKRLALLEAVNLALHRAMAEDEAVVVLGEDVGVNGGVFRATLGLRERFGFKRVLDTPLAENMIAGLSIGMAAQGLKPVMEIQFMGFIYAAMEQLVSHASRLRNRTRGRLACPLVLRTPMGAGIRAPEHHSEATEAMFAHIPGVRVLVPSSPARAYGLLLAAIDDPDPVIFLEPTRLYRMNPQPLADDARRLPLDSCFTLREGGDLTLVSWGASVHETQQAAERLAQRGIEAEVIDVACLKPLDLDTLEASVRKTGRCVIVHEAPKSGGLGGEIAASLYERVLFDLRAPIQRVAAADIPPPLYRLEPLYMPAVEDILAACDTVLGYA